MSVHNIPLISQIPPCDPDIIFSLIKGRKATREGVPFRFGESSGRNGKDPEEENVAQAMAVISSPQAKIKSGVIDSC
jgi:hypothetical protein